MVAWGRAKSQALWGEKRAPGDQELPPGKEGSQTGSKQRRRCLASQFQVSRPHPALPSITWPPSCTPGRPSCQDPDAVGTGVRSVLLPYSFTCMQQRALQGMNEEPKGIHLARPAWDIRAVCVSVLERWGFNSPASAILYCDLGCPTIPL